MPPTTTSRRGPSGVPGPAGRATGSSAASAQPGADIGKSSLTAPDTPLTIPASDDCHKLTSDRTQGVVGCATASTARGTITAVVVGVSNSQYVKVYRRQGNQAVLVLESTAFDPMSQVIGVGAIDPELDGSVKVAVVTGSPTRPGSPDPAARVDGYDLIDPPGVVSLHRTLLTGAVRLAPGGGVQDWQETLGARLKMQTLRYRNGAWTITQNVDNAPLPGGVPDGIAPAASR